MPYITSSIIVQLLGTVIPKFAEWREQGAVGQRKLTQATRYLTVALALMQSSGIVFLLHSGQLFSSSATTDRPDPGLHRAARAVHHPHLHRRHGLRDVARRAHHPARHRPGDVDPHLRQRRRDDPARRRASSRPTRAGRASSIIIAVVHRAARCDRLRRAGPAAHPGHLRAARPGAADVRRAEHLHPAQGQPGRRDPDHLRQLAALHPGAASPRSCPGTASATGCRTTCSRRPTASTSSSTASSSSSSPSSTCRSASTPTSRLTRSASRAGTSPASVPGRRRSSYLSHILNRITLAGGACSSPRWR